MLDQTRQPEKPPKLTFRCSSKDWQVRGGPRHTAAVPNTAAATDTQNGHGNRRTRIRAAGNPQVLPPPPNGYADGVMFGAYMGVEGTATIHVGDRLTVGHQPVDPWQ